MNVRIQTFLRMGQPVDLSYAEYLLLMHILERCDPKQGTSYFRRSYMAKRMGCEEDYIKRMTTKLEKLGYLRVYWRNHAYNRYVVLPLPGEILPFEEILPDGPTWTHKETGQVWILRNRGGHDDEAAYANPPAPEMPPAAATKSPQKPKESPPTPTISPEEAAFDAALDQADDEWERNSRKRTWYEYLVTLHGSPPFGKAAAEWDEMINDLIGKDFPMEDFGRCYAAAQKKWDAKATVHPVSVWNRLDQLIIIVNAERIVTRKREAVAAAMADEKPPELTEEQRAEAKRIEAELQAKREQRKEARIKRGIWVDGHTPNCPCPKCAESKRQYERQRSAANTQVTT